MKRMKFLNGIGAMFALAGVAIATTFTSCEKEDFNVNVDPINAQATIEATVLYVDENSTTNVTDQATINYSAGPTFTGNPTLESQTVTVTAEYQGITGSATVNVPYLGAGQFLSMSTTIILQEAAPAPVNAKAEVKPVVLLSADGVLTDIFLPSQLLMDNFLKLLKSTFRLSRQASMQLRHRLSFCSKCLRKLMQSQKSSRLFST